MGERVDFIEATRIAGDGASGTADDDGQLLDVIGEVQTGKKSSTEVWPDRLIVSAPKPGRT